MPESPRDARWLSDKDRSFLIAALARGQERGEQSPDGPNAIKNWRIWILALIYGLVWRCLLGNRALAATNRPALAELRPTEIGVLTALPYLLGTVTTFAAGWYADRIGSRPLMVIVCAILAAVGCSLSGLLATTPLWSFVALTGGIMALVMVPHAFPWRF